MIFGGLVCFSCTFGLLFTEILCLEAKAEDPPQFAWYVPQSQWYFNSPDGIAIDGSGNVYVADNDNSRIQKFSLEGTFLFKWGSFGSEDGQFCEMGGIAIDNRGKVYVADLGNHRIQKFTYANLAGFTVTEITGNTTEQGGQATFTISLNTMPSANVTIALSSSDTTEVSVSPTSLTFTPTNWNSPQTVTITGVDDFIDDGNIGYTITAQVVSSDINFNALTPYSISVTNNNNDSANITINPTAGLTTSENGTTTTFTVVLNTQPTTDVTINIVSSDTMEGTVPPASLIFTSSNWNNLQTVTITSLDDDIDDGNVEYTIISTLSSSDVKYSLLDPPDVSVTNVDDDSAALIINPNGGLTTSEQGDQDTFTVALGSKPTSDVTIDISLDETEGAILPTSLTFTPANWDSAQSVTVTGVDDGEDDCNQTYTITIFTRII